MFKKILHFLVILPALVSGQEQTDKLSVESGLVFNKYFPKEKINATNNQEVNYFLRFEYVGKTFSRDRWSLFIPIGISYSYYSVDYSNAGVGATPNFNTSNIYHSFSLSVGPQLQYQCKKLRFCGASLLNNQYISARVFALCHINKRLWIGPSFELFFYDLIYSLDEFRNKRNIPNYERGRIFGLAGRAIRFDPGIKLQLDLKY